MSAMTKQLKWTETEEDAMLEGRTTFGRHYYIDHGNHPEWPWKVWVPGERGAVARGWARTLDEAKQIAEEWEQAFRRYELPRPDAAATTQ